MIHIRVSLPAEYNEMLVLYNALMLMLLQYDLYPTGVPFANMD